MNATTMLFRIGGPILLLAALLFAAGGVMVALTWFGTSTPAAGLPYYLGLTLCAPAYAAWYATIGLRGGATGSIGFVLGVIGAVGYATGAFLLLPIDAGVQNAHEVWVFASVSVPVLPIGGLAFFIGSILLSVASLREPMLPRWAAWLALIGFAIWMFAFFAPPELAWLLTLANGLGAVGLGGIGWAIWSRPMAEPAG